MGDRPEKSGSVMDQKCSQCGKRLGPEVFLGPVCGKCVRKNHRKVTGKGRR